MGPNNAAIVKYATVGLEPWAVDAADRIKMDQKDRHVFAAALTAHADILLTENIKDFPTAKAIASAGLNIRIMTFGTFLTEILVANPGGFADVHRLTVKNLRGSDDSSVMRRLWGSAGQRHPAAVRSAARTLGLEAELNAEIVGRSSAASSANPGAPQSADGATCGIWMPRAKVPCVLATGHSGHHRSKRSARR